MNNIPNKAATPKRNRTTGFHVIWLILIPVFATVILLNLYRWNTDQKELWGILAPLGMIFIGLRQIFGDRNKTMSHVFSALALILIMSGLVAVAFF